MIIEILLGLAKFNSLYSIFFSSMEVHIIYVEKIYKNYSKNMSKNKAL